jgi:alcohol dehydrogenase class IV
VAIVDPELCRGATREVVAGAGFDAHAHAVETSASRASSPLTIGLAGLALPRLLDAVPRTLAAADDADAWGSSAYAALLMGINLANSTTCLPHRLQYPVGALTGTSHARGVAALFPAWLERTRRVAPAALARVARAGRLAAADGPDDAAADALVGAVLRHLDATGMRTRLGDLGVRPGDVHGLAAAVEGSLANDPGPATPEAVRDLYLASL